MADSNDLLGRVLERTSRSFYRTLRILPGTVRHQIGLAYLLARTSDTIADTDLVPTEERLKTLECFRDRIAGKSRVPPGFGQFVTRQKDDAERHLLEQCEASLRLLEMLSEGDLRLVRQVLGTIIGGQELDLRRFSNASRENVIALAADGDLDDYTYRVAGCVGEFWTRMCRAHVFPRAKLDDQFLLANGVRFGKGLQLVNILRDVPVDVRNGRCYMPSERLQKEGLAARDLLDSSVEGRFRPLYNSYLDEAEGHLRAGWAYTNALPRRSVRVRLACAWPILIGFDTLLLLRGNSVLDPERRIKISRSAVKKIIRRSICLYPFKAAWTNLAHPTELT